MNLLKSVVLSVICTFSCAASFAQTDSARSAHTDTTKSHTSPLDISTPTDTPQTRTVTAQPPANVGSLTGKLVDAKNKPVSYATVTLIRMDSTVVNGDLTKDDGSFNIAPTGIGNFLLRIESIGIAAKTITVQIPTNKPDKDLGSVKVVTTETSLGEVSVVGEKPIMELKVDKKVFNVEKNTTTAGGSAADVLQNVPSVSVDADGNVSLRGKSDVTILIDGKPSTLLGTDPASALQSLPAASIESVEVITNPSAKYDAQGTSGIINIVTKKDGRFGINGNVTLGAGTRDKYNGNLGLNLKKGKWNVFLNSSVRLNSSYNNITTDIDYHSYSSHTYEHAPRHFNGNFNSIGATYDANKYNSITLTENVNIMNFGFKDQSDYNVKDSVGTNIYNLNKNSDGGGGPVSTSTSLDYKKKFRKKDEELSVDGTFAYTSFQRSSNYQTMADSPFATHPLYGYPNSESAPGLGTNSTLNLWADYTDPLFTKNGRLGLGFKSQFYWFTSHNTPTITYPDIDSSGIDNTLLARYNYNQQIHAGYVNWNDQLGKFSYQVGLRVEDAVYHGTGSIPNDTSLHNSFFNLFPSAFISYQLNDQQSIYLNYSRRTNRPGFFELLPFIDASNPSTIRTGNPGLIPEFINNVEFSYSKSDKKGNNFILSAYYNYTQNLIERVTIPITAKDYPYLAAYTGQQLSIPFNLASGTTYGLEGTGHIQILPIWDATLNVNFFENQLIINKSDTANSKYLQNNSGFTWFGKINTNVKLPGGFSLQLNGNYESPKVIAQGTLKDTYWIDAAIKKNLWKNKATIVVNCSDIFKTHRYITTYNLLVYDETIDRVKETRVGNLTFTYRFGKTDVGKGAAGTKRAKATDANKPQIPTDEDREKQMKQGDDDNGGGGQGGGGNGGGKGGGAAH